MDQQRADPRPTARDPRHSRPSPPARAERPGDEAPGSRKPSWATSPGARKDCATQMERAAGQSDAAKARRRAGAPGRRASEAPTRHAADGAAPGAARRCRKPCRRPSKAGRRMGLAAGPPSRAKGARPPFTPKRPGRPWRRREANWTSTAGKTRRSWPRSRSRSCSRASRGSASRQEKALRESRRLEARKTGGRAESGSDASARRRAGLGRTHQGATPAWKPRQRLCRGSSRGRRSSAWPWIRPRATWRWPPRYLDRRQTGRPTQEAQQNAAGPAGLVA